MKIAYYNWRNDNKWRRLQEMRDDLCKGEFKWRFHHDPTNTWIAVGDNKLIEINDGISKWGVSEHYGPTFFSYDTALLWLKGEKEIIPFSPNAYDSTSSFDVIETDFSDQGLSFKIDVEKRALDLLNKKYLILPPIKRIEQNTKNGGSIYTTVIWEDNSDATVVKCAEDDIEDLYFAVASAIAIKLFGSNSAFKKVINEKSDILEEKHEEMAFSINMNNFAENIRKAFNYKGGVKND